MTKQTAGNNELLKGIKAMMNGKIYKRCVEIMNAEGNGSPQVIEYLQQFFNKPVDAAYFMPQQKQAVYGWKWGVWQIVDWK